MNTRVGRQCWSLAFATAVVLLNAVPPSRAAAPPAAADARLPVPPAAAVERAGSRVAERYRAELSAATAPEQKAALVRRMLETAGDTKDDAASRFALATVARDYAADARDVDAAFAAADLLSRTFQVDPLTARADAVGRLGKATAASPTDEVLVRGALTVVNDAVRADRYDVARAAAAVAAQAAKRVAGNEALVRRTAARAADVGAIEQAYRESRPAIAQLKRNALDVDAQSAVGRFLCLAKGDWDAGLKFLVQADDDATRAAALLDAAGSVTGPGRARIADAWWDLAERQPPGLTRDQMRRRAADWYNRAAGQLTGLTKARAEQRVVAAPQ